VTREQIIVRIMEREERDHAGGPDPVQVAELLETQGQAYVDKWLTERREYPNILRRVLEERLSASEYLTCEDFAVFDVGCCPSCHDSVCEHYDMYQVTLADGRHAWVCCPMKSILFRQTKKDNDGSDPDFEKKAELLAEIFNSSPDPVQEELHRASLAATTDEQRLTCSLRYAHHTYGRKDGTETAETLVKRALRLPVCGPATRATIAGANGEIEV
jgi:hypothetical protein